jgi:TonB family protein
VQAVHTTTRAIAVVVLLIAVRAGAQQKSGFVPPEITKRATADYPPEALKKELSGTVVLEFDVDEQGKVSNVQVKQGAGHGFDEAAVEAIKRFEFKPATNDGNAVSAHVTYAYKFVIKTQPKPIAKPPDEVVRMKGGVFLRGTRAPVAGGRVLALPKEKKPDLPEVYSGDIDEKGQFAIKGMPPGRYQIIVNGPKAKRYETEESVGDKEVLTVNYFVEPSLYTRYESVVRAEANREEISRQVLTTEELVKMPGSMGDALKAVENLPGVARSPFNSGLIVVRGGKPTDSKVFIGASEVSQLYHFAGLRSVVPSEFIDRIELMSGNFGVRYGRAIAGVVDVELREPKRDRWHFAGETNAFDTGATVEGPVGKGALMMGARRSYIDGVLGVALPKDSGLAFQSAPVYYDYQAVLDYPVGGGKLRAQLTGSDDVLKLVFDRPADGDPAISAFGTHLFFHKLQLRWTRSIGRWSILTQLAGGYTGQQGALGSQLNYDIGIGQIDGRVEARYRASKSLRLLFGSDWVWSHVMLNLKVPPPPREGQIPSPISALATQQQHEVQDIGLVGLYAEAQWTPHEKVTITPGLRFDFYSPLRLPSFDPRLTMRFQVAKYTALKTGVGHFSQPPLSTDYNPVFGNPRLRPEKAIHTSLGIEQGLLPGLVGEVTGFYKHLYDLSTPTQNFELREGVLTPERVANVGDGRVYGMEVQLRQKVSKWLFGFASYTLMRSERRDCASCPYRTFDFDQTHILILALHTYLPKGFEIGARFRYITGLPYTPTMGGYYDSDSDVYSPAPAAINTGRLADFHSLDLRFDKTFLFKRWLLKVYLDITNLYNRANEEVNQPSYDFTRRAAITGLPIIPSFGIRGEF